MKRLIKKKSGRLFAIWTPTNGEGQGSQHSHDNRNIGSSDYRWRCLGSTLASSKTTVMSVTTGVSEISRDQSRRDGPATLEQFQSFLMINAVLSSISSSFPVWSKSSSFLTESSSKALQMSFADSRQCSRSTASSLARSWASLPSYTPSV